MSQHLTLETGKATKSKRLSTGNRITGAINPRFQSTSRNKFHTKNVWYLNKLQFFFQ